MPQFSRLVHEIHRRSLWQVLGIYAVGCWIAYQVVLDLSEGLGLPVWLPGLAAVLFVIGLPIVVATAFVQQGTLGESFEVPPPNPPEPGTPGPRYQKRTAGPIRRILTWRNAGLGGIAAFALWGVVAAIWLLTGASSPSAGSTIPEEQPGVAVLPFVAIGDDPETEVFAHGVHEDVITHLSKVSGLRVISSGSVTRFRDSDIPIFVIGEELGVRAVMEGSVRRLGDRVRVTAQLIDARTDGHLWADVYDRDVGDTFAVQSEIAIRIAEALSVALTPEDQARLVARQGAVHPEARQHFLRGRYYWGRRDEPSIRLAMENFEAALAIQPDYALAYAGLADAYVLLPFYGAEPASVSFGRARTAAEKALALDPSLAEPHATLGLVHRSQDLDWPGAERSFRRAIELQPNYATAYQWLGQILSLQGRDEEAAVALDRAMDLDPLSSTVVGAAADAAFYAGRLDEALRLAQFVRELGGTPGVARMGRIRLALEDTARAVIWAERAVDVGVPLGHAYAGYLLARVGRSEEAAALLQGLREREVDQGMPTAMTALVLIGLDRPDEALDALEASLVARDPWFTFVILDPAFETLGENPRWIALRARAGLPQE